MPAAGAAVSSAALGGASPGHLDAASAIGIAAARLSDSSAASTAASLSDGSSGATARPSESAAEASVKRFSPTSARPRLEGAQQMD